MGEEFEKKLASKIKDTLSNHSFEYDNGAWENYQNYIKKRKKRGIVWFFVGAASLVLLLTFIGFQFINKEPFSNLQNQKLTRQQEVRPSLNNKMEGDNSEKKTKDLRQTKSGKFPIVQQVYIRNASPKKEDRKGPFTRFHNNKINPLESYGPVLFTNSFRTSSLKKEMLTPLVFNPDEEFDSLFLEENDDSFDKKTKYPVEIGLQFVPAYGLGNGGGESFTSTNIGGGIDVEIPINASCFSINTGAIFNSINLSNEQSMIAASGFSGEVETTTNSESVNLLSIDIPFNLRYNFTQKKNNFYLQTGWSSYLTFQEDIEILERTTIEVDEFDVQGNETGNSEIIELFSSEETSKNTQIQLVPLGTINLSIGYRSKLSKDLVYELQPFYKYPLNSLSSENIRIPTGGIALKIVFSR
ncbi:MAG: hypothetical protein AAGA43_04600 [Bacteroidota bacterium]